MEPNEFLARPSILFPVTKDFSDRLLGQLNLRPVKLPALREALLDDLATSLANHASGQQTVWSLKKSGKIAFLKHAGALPGKL